MRKRYLVSLCTRAYRSAAEPPFPGSEEQCSMARAWVRATSTTRYFPPWCVDRSHRILVLARWGSLVTDIPARDIRCMTPFLMMECAEALRPELMQVRRWYSMERPAGVLTKPHWQLGGSAGWIMCRRRRTAREKSAPESQNMSTMSSRGLGLISQQDAPLPDADARLRATSSSVKNSLVRGSWASSARWWRWDWTDMSFWSLIAEAGLRSCGAVGQVGA